ncbi:MAG: GGDEF domain-containing protein [Gammaproteobacteria bacterium]|nr:GGDEF domain-containing protein [Gammaproteobacteria bacterium]MCW5583329.1 GGDEF domain-containing protein [Gammaproteobacteria bacterium]
MNKKNLLSRVPSKKTSRKDTVKSQIPGNIQELVNRLNQIIHTQSSLYETDFDLDPFMNLVTEQVQNLTGATGASIEFVDGDNMVCQTAAGSLKNHLGLPLDKHNSISSLCVSTHQALRSDNTETDPRVNIEACQLSGIRSLVVAPLFREKTAVGVLKITSKKYNAFSEIDVQTLKLMAGFIDLALVHQMLYERTQLLLTQKNLIAAELREAEKKLKNLVHHDDLTGLPNRNLLNDRLHVALSKAKRKKQSLALIYLDIDHFKNVNSTMGYQIGDKLLAAFASRLKQCVRASDTVARLGGDEFVLIIDGINDAQDVIDISKKILRKIHEPFHLQNKKIQVTASIGISFLSENTENADALIKQADQALYVSKNSGRNTFYIFDNELNLEKI